MPPRRAPALLWDIIDGARFIERELAGCTYDDYLADQRRRLAVERSLEIIGEATRQLRDRDSQLSVRLTDAHKAIGLRNVLAHGYADLEHDKVWIAITEYLPTLRAEAEALYVELGYVPPDGSD